MSRFVRMPRKLRYNIIREPPKDVGTNAKTEETTVGSITRGVQTSREQPRDRAPPISSSANGAPVSRISEPFYASRNNHRLAQLSSADDPQTPTERIETRHHAPRSRRSGQQPETQRYRFLGKDGVRKVSRLSVKEAIALPSNTKIVLPFNKELQPIGQAARLFSGFLRSLGVDYSQFPIYAESWKHVNKAKKKHAYDMIKDAIVNVERQDESSKHLSQNDSLAQVLRKEHLGRLRALGAGPCPTQVFDNTAGQLPGSAEPNEEYERGIAKLMAKLEEKQAKRQSIHKVLGYLVQQQGGNLPAEVVVELAFLGSTPD
ncbi:hypothetical protein Ahy_A04g020402 [Arachis hypogaea]|uniref:Uncharacterized protein n=1 Tax=Arachis hypogaea TaxID=3818 RepID=A0A445DHU3_ARAHY|nr:hypothetical protein Ahy_A04g020402 [Arachis hypogaea]